MAGGLQEVRDRNLAADTIFIAEVICMVFCTEVMRSRTS